MIQKKGTTNTRRVKVSKIVIEAIKGKCNIPSSFVNIVKDICLWAKRIEYFEEYQFFYRKQ